MTLNYRSRRFRPNSARVVSAIAFVMISGCESGGSGRATSETFPSHSKEIVLDVVDATSGRVNISDVRNAARKAFENNHVLIRENSDTDIYRVRIAIEDEQVIRKQFERTYKLGTRIPQSGWLEKIRISMEVTRSDKTPWSQVFVESRRVSSPNASAMEEIVSMVVERTIDRLNRLG